MEDLIEITSGEFFDKRPTLKEIYREKSGQSISLDYFLYTCLEEEKVFSAAIGNYREEKRWPALTSGSTFDNTQPLQKALADLFRWYGENYPMLLAKSPLDYTVHSNIIMPFALMTMDLTDIFHKLNKAPIPFRDPPKPEIWEEIDTELKKHFGHYASYMLAYFNWSFQKPKPPVYDLVSLPPIGRYIRILNRSIRMQEDAAYAAPTPRKVEQPQRTEPAETTQASTEEGSKKRSPEVDEVAALEEQRMCLKEVEDACAQLKRDLSLSDFTLKPRNSFIRRMQHQRVMELGLFSHSVGEGPDRTLHISRNKQPPS